MYTQAYRIYTRSGDKFPAITLLGNSEADVRQAWADAHQRAGIEAPVIFAIVRVY